MYSYANPLILSNDSCEPSWESIDSQTEVSANTLNKEGCKKRCLWLGTFILSQYIITSQISFALSTRGKGQDKHFTFAIFVLLLVIGLLLEYEINCYITKLYQIQSS